MSQERASDAKFELYNSFCVEEVSEAFNRRLDRFLALMLFVLGASIIATVTSRTVIGLMVAIISGLQITYKFGEKAGKSKSQKSRYAELMSTCNSISDKSLSSKLAVISRSDSSVSEWMRAVGQKKACIMLGEDTDVVLTRWQRFLAAVSGAGPITTQTI